MRICFANSKPSMFGHHQIKQQQAIRLSGGRGPLHLGQSRCAASATVGFIRQLSSSSLKNALVGRIVVNDQHAHALQR